MSKAKGETPVQAPVGQPTAVIDLMAALKQSLEKEGAPARKPAARAKRTPAAAEPAAPAKPARRRKAS